MASSTDISRIVLIEVPEGFPEASCGSEEAVSEDESEGENNGVEYRVASVNEGSRRRQ